MNTNILLPLSKALGVGMAVLLFALPTHAAEQQYSDIPLFWGNGVAPNVALIMDNSGTMNQQDTDTSGTISKICTTGTFTAPLTRIQAAQNAACDVVNDNASGMRIGVFASSNSGTEPATTTTANIAANAAVVPSPLTTATNFTQNNATNINSAINGIMTTTPQSFHTPMSTTYNSVLSTFFGASSPIQYRCQKNYIVEFSNGHPNVGMDTYAAGASGAPALAATHIQQTSTWLNSTAKTGLAFTDVNGWRGFTNVQIPWNDVGSCWNASCSSYSHNWSPWTWLDDLSQMAYDVDIKDSTSPAVTGCPAGSPGSSVGKDCAGKSWDGSDDTNPAQFTKQNVVTYVVGFGVEANQEPMRDIPLVNKVSVTPSQVNTTNDTITITGHGLSTGDYVHYYKMPDSNKVLTAYDANSATSEQVTVTASTPAPADTSSLYTGMPLTYSNGGGTTLQYDLVGSYTPTCAASSDITPLVYGTPYFISSASGTSFQLKNSTGTVINLTGTGTTGVNLTFSPAVTGAAQTTANLNTTGNTPIDPSLNMINIVSHGFYNGELVTYKCSSATTAKCIGGLGVGPTNYYIISAAPNKFQISSTFNGSAVVLSYVTSTGGQATFTPVANAGSNVSFVAASGTTPVNTGTEVITAANSFVNNEAVTYSCANGAPQATHTNSSLATYYAIKVDNTHFQLATSAANAVAGTAANIVVAGNAAQTFTFNTNGTIGGLWAYETDQAPGTGGVTPTVVASPTVPTVDDTSNTGSGAAYLPDPSTDTGARGKYFVEVIDKNTIKLHQCMGFWLSPFSITFGSGTFKGYDLWANSCFTPATNAVDLTSQGSGYLSTGPGKYYYAASAGDLSTAMRSAFVSINAQTLSQASLSQNSSQLGSGSYVYQASFNTADWSGDVKAFDVSSGTINTASPVWKTSANVPSAATRKLLTWQGGAGILFPSGATTGLSSTPGLTSVNQLASVNSSSAVVDWVRGTDGTLRARTNGVIGDILNGSPVYVGVPDGLVHDGGGSISGVKISSTTMTEASTYGGFVIANNTRTPMLYAGANDGMLHGLNVANNGTEMVGYIPGGVYTDWVDAGDDAQLTTETRIDKFNELSTTGYGVTSGKPHRYFVDGQPFVGDAYWGGNWHTVLVGGLGKGGRTVYALDITTPTSAGSSNFTASNVLWEFGSGRPGCDGTSGSTLGCMGYSYSRPVIARLSTGKWAAIFGNGYDSKGDQSRLFIVDLQNGTVIKEFTPSGSFTGTGLSSVTVRTDSTTGVAQDVYAGDLNGTVWRFNISSATVSSWTVSALYVATDGTNRQPITSAVTLGDNSVTGSGKMVYFGTGRYFTTADQNYVSGTSTPAYDSLYAVWDNDSGSTVTKSLLQSQTLSASGSNRVATSNAVTYTGSGAGSRGWYLDLKVSTQQGERVTYSPLLVGTVLFVTSVVPTNTDPCTGGGTSWLYGLNALTGSAASIFDLNNDGAYDTGVSGIQSGNGVYSAPAFFSTGANTGVVLVNTSGGSIDKFNVNTCPGCTSSTPGGLNSGRMSWRQLQ